MAEPSVAPLPPFAADFAWLAARGLVSAMPDGAFRRTAKGQRLVATSSATLVARPATG